ncbi:outer membrane protein assembly factor BamB [Thalassotalea eurytherma]|uniref:Outer membrane protein assembly factor BamB n=1 Tax=Thalassotalea eurytherma TaxID=1144278 RepID=A0ABQ6H5K5_9GAMM|nr:outer membrane protein assembly factor BamB [Thalassotalea eurytherma]GLX82445.1 outer membrane protein assembly factor BamB [Thalassotalea eurytherma]
MQLLPKKILTTLALVLTLAACSSTDDENEAIAVAELTDIEQQFEPQVVWSESVGDGIGDFFSRLKPAIAYDKVFSASREGDVIAFEEATGKKLWQINLRKPYAGNAIFFGSDESAMLSGGPVTGGRKVYIGSENGDVYAIDEATGDTVWQVKVKGEVIAAPTFENNVVLVNTVSGLLTALDAKNGEELWQVEQDVPPLTLRGISAPSAASGGVLIGTPAGELTVYILESGQQGWSVNLGEATGSTELDRVVDVDSKPLVLGETVYSVSSRGQLSALELRSGRVLWQRQYSSYRQISISRNNIYLTDVKGHVYAVDRLNGLERWSNALLTNRNVTGPAVHGKYVVVGDFEGYLHWLDAQTGDIVARTEIDSSGVYTTPTVSGGILYVQSRDGDLEAIKLP